MRCSRRSALSLLCATAGAATHSRATASTNQPELAVIAHPGNSRTLTREEIEGVFRTTRRYWSAGQPIVALNLPAGSADRMHFDRAVLRLDPDDVARYWIDRKIRGGEPPPRTVANPMLLVRVVAQLAAGIGYVPVHLLTPSVRVVARVQGGNLIIAGKAPS